MLERLGVDRSIVIGDCGGGPVALQYALQYPRRVAALGLVETFSTFDDMVIGEDLRHAFAQTRELIERAGAKLVFLPPYSPDLNPIEMIFSKIKQKLRSLACRTRDALWRCMQSVLDTITPDDASNCFQHCGYTLQGD